MFPKYYVIDTLDAAKTFLPLNGRNETPAENTDGNDVVFMLMWKFK